MHGRRRPDGRTGVRADRAQTGDRTCCSPCRTPIPGVCLADGTATCRAWPATRRWACRSSPSSRRSRRARRRHAGRRRLAPPDERGPAHQAAELPCSIAPASRSSTTCSPLAFVMELQRLPAGRRRWRRAAAGDGVDRRAGRRLVVGPARAAHHRPQRRPPPTRDGDLSLRAFRPLGRNRGSLGVAPELCGNLISEGRCWLGDDHPSPGPETHLARWIRGGSSPAFTVALGARRCRAARCIEWKAGRTRCGSPTPTSCASRPGRLAGSIEYEARALAALGHAPCPRVVVAGNAGGREWMIQIRLPGGVTRRRP